MSKWADYCIFAVGYDSDETLILEVTLAEDLGGSLGVPKQASRQYVVSEANKGKTFVTVLQNDKGMYTLGSSVEVVNHPNGEYIRTVGNSSLHDNLENLPRY